MVAGVPQCLQDGRHFLHVLFDGRLPRILLRLLWNGTAKITRLFLGVQHQIAVWVASHRIRRQYLGPNNEFVIDLQCDVASIGLNKQFFVPQF